MYLSRRRFCIGISSCIWTLVNIWKYTEMYLDFSLTWYEMYCGELYLTTSFLVFRGSMIRRTLNLFVRFWNHLLFIHSFNLSTHVVKVILILQWYFPPSSRMAFYVSHSIKSVWIQKQFIDSVCLIVESIFFNGRPEDLKLLDCARFIIVYYNIFYNNVK